ncbi:ABC transporter permease [Pseudobutyrivibrio xylanivorans]|uniref:Transport permease protein n=1 Tax=Pseudobutyrivibrio xylanivorans TaxID=185007 RepID=A0A5P6VMX9_PSEXY|nr:ABC transporter permease [Pseudobutyrivibrio xylanivorans]QFJ53762.1 hypothetical protein FXF36_02185 [Pseudobutyrivibrio xylanivorans]
MRENINKVRQNFFIIRQISYKDSVKKTAETNLGFFWNIFNPFIYMIVLSLYYQNIITHDIDKFPAFVFVGIIIYNFYNSASKGAMRCLVSNKNLIVRAKVSPDIFICEKIFSAWKEVLYSFIAYIPIIIYFHVKLSWRVVILIPIFLLMIMTICGMGKILAVAYVFFADVDYLYSIFIMLLFYVSGVFLPLDHMPIQFQQVLSYNPIFLSIYLTRDALLYSQASHWTAWLKLLIWAFGLMLFGSWLFEKNRNRIIGKL